MNDNESQRYSIRHYPPGTSPYRDEGWRVLEGDHPISIRFATKMRAVRCRDALIAYDERWPNPPGPSWLR